MINVTEAEVSARLAALRTVGIPVHIGPVGVVNATGLMDVGLFLRATQISFKPPDLPDKAIRSLFGK